MNATPTESAKQAGVRTPEQWIRYGGGKRRWCVGLAGGGHCVCQMTRHEKASERARLIAAAHDLLRALEHGGDPDPTVSFASTLEVIADLMDKGAKWDTGIQDGLRRDAAAIRAAIARATGGGA